MSVTVFELLVLGELFLVGYMVVRSLDGVKELLAGILKELGKRH